MVTREDIESFLDRLSSEGASYTEVEPGLWTIKSSGALDLGEVVREKRGHDRGGAREAQSRLGPEQCDVVGNAHHAICQGVMPVVAELVAHEQRNQRRACNTQCQPRNVDRRLQPLREQLSNGHREVAAKHGASVPMAQR